MKQNIKKINTEEIMALFIAISDTIALVMTSSIAVFLRYIHDGKFNPVIYAQLLPALLIFFALFATRKLYPGILLSPPDELKRLAQSITLAFLLLAAIVFLSKHSERYSRGIFLMAWSMALVAVPVLRTAFRLAGCKLGIWGVPAIILGAGNTGQTVADTLLSKPTLGLKPTLFLDDDPDKIGSTFQGIPVLGPLDFASSLTSEHHSAVAVLAFPSIDRERLKTVIDKYTCQFRRVILIPDLLGISNLWVSTADLGGILGLDIRHKLLDPRRQMIKRIMEIFIILATLPLSAVLMAVIALAVKMDSPGPILFRHKRIGFGGRDITIWKFRTMVEDAETRLQECLKDPELLALWQEQHKLPSDPRITRIGRFLRATSLDELPQLINVIQGELSLVGPRPIVWAEAERYKEGFDLYTKVRPGLTGLWQVSGRSTTSYAFRVSIDKYYVRNWSVWMDIYILAKTPLAVLSRKGAF